MGIGSISYLPESFARYSLADVPDALGWAGAGNTYTMANISANLKMTGDPSLGLDANGRPAKKDRRILLIMRLMSYVGWVSASSLGICVGVGYLRRRHWQASASSS